MSGEPDASFVTQHRGLVTRLAVDLKRRYRLAIELDELIAAGMQGLVEADRAYDAERGVAFTSFAYYRIRGAILDTCRKLGAMRRQYGKRARFEAAANDVLAEAAEAAPAESAGGAQLGRWIGGAFDSMAAAWELSHGTGGETRQRASSPERSASQRQLVGRLREHLAALGPQEREVIEAYYFDDHCMADIAARFGVSKSWVSRVHTRALRKLRALVLDD